MKLKKLNRLYKKASANPLLVKTYKQKISNASEDELKEVDSIGPKLAKNIYEVLN